MIEALRLQQEEL
jgi:hypothetical protein